MALPAGFVLPACAPVEDDGSPPEIVWEGRWLDYGADADTPPVCPGTLRYMDEYLETLFDHFGVAPTEKARYYHVSSQERVPCANADGCVRGHAAWTWIAPQEHELVHLARSYADFSR